MASVTRFGHFLSKNWVLDIVFRCQYPRGAGKPQSGSKIPAGSRKASKRKRNTRGVPGNLKRKQNTRGAPGKHQSGSEIPAGRPGKHHKKYSATIFSAASAVNGCSRVS